MSAPVDYIYRRPVQEKCSSIHLLFRVDLPHLFDSSAGTQCEGREQKIASALKKNLGI